MNHLYGNKLATLVIARGPICRSAHQHHHGYHQSSHEHHQPPSVHLLHGGWHPGAVDDGLVAEVGSRWSIRVRSSSRSRTMEFFRMLTIWGRRSSFNVQKVMWLVGELRIDHRQIDAGGQFGGLDTRGFRTMNPHGRVPVIDDNGTVVWESHAILRYLAARYGPSQFWSEDASERSQVDRWMDWAQTALQPDFLMGVFWGFYRTPESQRNWPAIRKKIARCSIH